MHTLCRQGAAVILVHMLPTVIDSDGCLHITNGLIYEFKGLSRTVRGMQKYIISQAVEG